MKLARATVIFDAGMYGGKQQVPGYTAGGLATFKVGKVWFITHASSAWEVNSRCRPPSKKHAEDVISSLLSLPIPWEKNRDDKEFMKAFTDNREGIRAATQPLK